MSEPVVIALIGAIGTVAAALLPQLFPASSTTQYPVAQHLRRPLLSMALFAVGFVLTASLVTYALSVPSSANTIQAISVALDSSTIEHKGESKSAKRMCVLSEIKLSSPGYASCALARTDVGWTLTAWATDARSKADCKAMCW